MHARIPQHRPRSSSASAEYDICDLEFSLVLERVSQTSLEALGTIESVLESHVTRARVRLNSRSLPNRVLETYRRYESRTKRDIACPSTAVFFGASCDFSHERAHKGALCAASLCDLVGACARRYTVL